QTAEPVRTLVDHDVVAGAGQLLGARESGGAGADDRDPLAGALGGAARTHPALVPGTVDDRQLDLLDRDRVSVDRQNPGRLARGRAQPAGELREVFRRMQALDGGTPVVVGYELVPLPNQIAERAARMAEGFTVVRPP